MRLFASKMPHKKEFGNARRTLLISSPTVAIKSDNCQRNSLRSSSSCDQVRQLPENFVEIKFELRSSPTVAREIRQTALPVDGTIFCERKLWVPKMKDFCFEMFQGSTKRKTRDGRVETQ